MKEKLLQALKTKYKNLGLSEKILEQIAANLEVITTEETQIETAVAGVENLLKSFQSEADRIRTEAAKPKTDPKKDEDKKDPEPEPKPASDEVPAWAKSLIESNKTLTEKLSQIESGKTKDTRLSILEGKIKDAPKAIKDKLIKDFSRMTFEKDEDFETYLTETEADLSSLSQELSDKGVSSFVPKTGASGKNIKEATKEEVEAVMKNLM